MRRILQEIRSNEVPVNSGVTVSQMSHRSCLHILPVRCEAEWVCWVNNTVFRGRIVSLLMLDVSSFRLQ